MPDYLFTRSLLLLPNSVEAYCDDGRCAPLQDISHVKASLLVMYRNVLKVKSPGFHFAILSRTSSFS
jgi:hypothetical protein